jgi:hypothetical protein
MPRQGQGTNIQVPIADMLGSPARRSAADGP